MAYDRILYPDEPPFDRERPASLEQMRHFWSGSFSRLGAYFKKSERAI